ncbi:MAG: hypothetical protein DSM106950_02120 [Stigonema ocellatum SAG 48.90 = DSM 106950]|nr:hypothetical protein [Stigonema ocellatum SAG 48.90 = DSM 106950]
MPKVLIVVEPSGQEVTDSPTLKGMLAALELGNTKDFIQVTSVEVVAANNLESKIQGTFKKPDSCLSPVKDQTSKIQEIGFFEEIIFCPLTLCLPENLVFPSQGIFQACRDVASLRQRVADKMQIAISDGCFWLPVVLTAKGPLYGEVISLASGRFTDTKSLKDLSLSELSYYQPFHLSDALRQPLYQVAYQLLQSLSAPPATYLVQFGLQKDKISFDRLWPFPTTPALASIGIQQPDLFTSHLYCLAAKPLLDLTIMSSTD